MYTDTVSKSHRSRAEASAQPDPMPLQPILRRAGIVALVIGSALTLINQSAALFGPARLELLPLILVFMTPFLVVAESQVLGIGQARRELNDGVSLRHQNVRFWSVLAGHGIPFRAVLIGLIAGSANSVITIVAQMISGAQEPSIVLIAQAYLLPMLFGALSQALAYRRARAETAA